MKTSIDLPEQLIRDAKRVALDRQVTFRSLVILGLETVIRGEQSSKEILDALADLDPSPWQGIDADAFVAEQRKGWE
ncbi:MAG: hypothetical protein ACFE0O_05400 [Opitutales bacterium]